MIGDEYNDTFTGGKGNDVFVYTAGDDVITDYSPLATKNNGDKIILQDDQSISSFALSGKDVILTVGNADNAALGTIKIIKGKDRDITVGDRTYIFGNGTATLKVTSVEALKDIEDFVTAADASKLKDALDITSNDKGLSIKCGSGADTLRGGSGADTFTGGKGNDVFVYGGGQLVITDYSPLATKNNGDRIMLANDQQILSSSLKGSNVILTVGNYEGDSIGTVQINKVKGKDVTVNDRTYIFGNGTATLKPQSGGFLTVEDDFVTAIDASKLKEPTDINGNDKGLLIKGGTVADILRGGSGNDTLTGGKGNDVFEYSAGNDVITDYSPLATKNNGDRIRLEDGQYIMEVEVKGSNIVLTVGEGIDKIGTIQVNKGKNRDMTINDETRKFTKSEMFTGFSYNLASVEEYWFTQSNREPDDLSATDELIPIMEIKPLADEALNFNDFSKLNKVLCQELSSNAITRHKLKK